MITLWHNPRCSKSRAALALIDASGHPVTIRLYLKDTPGLAELDAARTALGVAAIDMMRTGEQTFKNLGLSTASPDETLLRAMADHPILIERPIAFAGSRAAIGRPPEAIADLL
ncbi:arsenate reductase (glutaredoxin) [Sulfitobacter sabulilitoris]|uniref:Arsenate reductase n=1 Tax=Sulfitobacter sabulilitoris TaxID=2562655 RepID=A0A5S3PM55_9RHOB|nr:arsenate reductase (glutaredoxin) [Sulfitobacter sabulilitoris]TMM55366.1 arsenate reductase (glutaredoxin) [Sulfitobacter sabulilitoris]